MKELKMQSGSVSLIEMNRDEHEKPLTLFLNNLPSRGTLTDLVTGCIVPSNSNQPERTVDSKQEDCFRIANKSDPPLIVDLKTARRKKQQSTISQRSKQVQKCSLKRRGVSDSPSSKHKRPRVKIDVTLLDACGHSIVTDNPVQTEQKLSSKLKAELVQIASRLGLQTIGAKSDIVARLMKQYHHDRRTAVIRARRLNSLNE